MISIAGSQLYGQTYASFNFYSLPSRYWEIALGAIIAIHNIEFKIKDKKYKSFISNLGLILILFSFIYYDDTYLHPQLDTSLAVIGTGLLVYSDFKFSFAYKILTSRILVFIGLISYSLYLWHYSIFSIARYLSPGEILISSKILLLILTFTISIFSYHFIEQPFRNSIKINKKLLIKTILLTYSAIIFILLFYLQIGGFVNEKKLLNIENDNEKLRKIWLSNINSNQYSTFENNSKKKVLIIGNSHARDLFNIFNSNLDIFMEYDFAIFDSQIECFLKNIKKDYSGKCEYLYEKPNIEIIDNNFYQNFSQAEYIILSTQWSFLDVLRLEDEVIPFLKKNYKKIIVTSNSPRFFFNIKDPKNPFTLLDIKLRNIKEENFSINSMENIEKLHYKSMTKPIIKLNNWLEEISKRNDVLYLRKENFICKMKLSKCHVVTDKGFKIFWDNSHLTIEGASFFGKIIDDLNWLKLD